MTELDQVVERLHCLGQRIPGGSGDPTPDIRRGRAALRRRHARRAYGVTAALVAVGAVVSSTPMRRLGGDDNSILGPAGSASGVPTTSSPAKQGESIRADLCDLPAPDDPSHAKGRDPKGTMALNAYRDAAASILDPSGAHLDPAGTERTSSFGGYDCNPVRRTMLGAKIGWNDDAGALGVILIEVDSAATKPGDLQIVMDHTGWTKYVGVLPSGVTAAEVVSYHDSGNGDGHAVVVQRADGLTVAVDAGGLWGNNVLPGSTPATHLPDIGQLLTLAASPKLWFPEE